MIHRLKLCNMIGNKLKFEECITEEQEFAKKRETSKTASRERIKTSINHLEKIWKWKWQTICTSRLPQSKTFPIVWLHYVGRRRDVQAYPLSKVCICTQFFMRRSIIN